MDRLGPVLEFLFELFDPTVQRLELGGRGEQLFELPFVGLTPTLLIGVSRLFVLLEEVAQVGLARLDPRPISITKSSVTGERRTSSSTSFSPASMRLAISTSCSRERSWKLPISLR